MKELYLNETQLISGGLDYSSLLNVSCAAMGGYIGSSLGYMQPLMAQVITMSPTGQIVSTISPHFSIILSGVMLGASIGYAISESLQQSYHSL
jgi:hypothetical protein